MNDNVNHPQHYTSSLAACSACHKPIECIDVTRHMSFAIGNAVKYIWRHGDKGKPIEDLEKAVWYLNDAIKQLKANKPNLINQPVNYKPQLIKTHPSLHACGHLDCNCLFPSVDSFMDDKVDEALGIGDS